MRANRAWHESPVGLAIARDVLKSLRSRDREWEEECQRSYQKGERPSHCKHGTNLWSEYDPICGACEEALDFYQEASLVIWHRWRHHVTRQKAVQRALEALKEETRGEQLPLAIWDTLAEWAWEPTHLKPLGEHEHINHVGRRFVSLI